MVNTMFDIRFRIKDENGNVLRTCRDFFKDEDQTRNQAQFLANKLGYVEIFKCVVRISFNGWPEEVLHEEICDSCHKRED